MTLIVEKVLWICNSQFKIWAARLKFIIFRKLINSSQLAAR